MAQSSIDIAALIDGRRISAFQYAAIGLCALAMIIDGFDTQAISYAAPLIGKQWGLSGAALGPMFSSGLVGLMVGYLALPPLSDRFGHRRVIILSTLFFAIFTLLTAFSEGITELITLRFLTGIGLGGVAPSAIALTGEYSPRRLRATFILIIYCGFSFGFVLAGFAAANLLPSFGWPSIFYFGGALSLLLATLLIFLLPESLGYLVLRGGDRDRTRAILQRIDGSRGIPADAAFVMAQREGGKLAVTALFRQGRALATVLLWLVFFINLAEFYALQSWLPSILNGMHYPMDMVALTTSLTTVGGIVIAFIVGPAMDRLGSYVTVGTLYLFGTVVVVLTGAVLSSPPLLVMLAAFLTGVCVSGGQKSVIALAAVYYPATIRSTGVGWALGIGRLGGIAGPMAVGFLFGAGWTPQAVFYVAGLPLLIASSAIFIIGRLQDRGTIALEALSQPEASPRSV